MKRSVLAALASLALSAGCSSTTTGASGATCPSNSTLTYDTFGKAFMASYCTKCHTSGSGADADAVKSGGSYDDLASIKAHKTAIDSEAAGGATQINNDMPESGNPTPTDAERKQLGEWIACGLK